MLQKLLPLIGLLLVLAACNNKKASNNADDMAQFAEDTAFQAAHATPDSMTFQGQGQMIQFPTPDGKQASAYAVLTDQPSNKYLLVFHEWWGLNDYIKRESERLFDSLDNVNVLALDLYDGKIATSQEDAGKLMETVSQNRGEAIIKGALEKIGDQAEISTIGWCFGGGWSLKGGILAGDRGKATVMYYGMPVQNAKELAPIKADILAIFAKQDQWITPEVASKFEKLAKSTGKDIEVVSFDANHAFANPSQPSYNEQAAQEANKMALQFLRTHL